MDLHHQLAELRRVIENARSMPMSASAVINRPEVLAMIDRLAADLPGAFVTADRVVKDRDTLIGEGREQAEAVIVAAETQRDRLVSETEVYRVAQGEAEQLLDKARKESQELRRDADGYVDAKLATFEISLTKTLQAVARGRERLRGRSELDTLGSDADAEDEPGGGAP